MSPAETHSQQLSGWGRLDPRPHRVLRLRAAPERLPLDALPLLARGHGRSYGDSASNPEGCVLDARGLDHLIEWDPSSGLLRAEAGVDLATLLQHFVPRGWMPAVLPGTSKVTLGGAVANDVHGKNHALAGSFGEHVVDLDLLRSDGLHQRISRAHEPGLFAATIGGLGLTGLILRVGLKLRPVPGPWLELRQQRASSLQALIDGLACHSEDEYGVAWIDCMARGAALGRGVLQFARHCTGPARQPRQRQALRVPLVPPFNPLRTPLLRAFNALLWHRPRPRGPRRVHYRGFFFPLDGLGDWNRLYGPAGFYQYQCVIPPEAAGQTLPGLLRTIAQSGQGSPLAVLKRFGERPAAGLLSFPRAGWTLALDFPNRGAGTLRLLRELDAQVRDAGGALYPAKDARMDRRMLEASFPRLPEFLRWHDPAFGSAFWSRVMGA